MLSSPESTPASAFARFGKNVNHNSLGGTANSSEII